MITRLFSAALRGVDAQEVEVEVNAHGADKPIIIIVGLPDAAVRESSQRVWPNDPPTALAGFSMIERSGNLSASTKIST